MFARWPRSLREGVFLFGVIVLAYVLLSLYSYSAADPSPATTGGGAAADNWGGRIGAYAAALLFEFFGRSAYLLCFIAALCWRWTLFKPADEDDEHAVGWRLSLVGVALCVVSAAAVEYLRFHGGGGGLPAGAGGWVGHHIGRNMLNLFGQTGASLLLFSICVLSWSLVFRLSWFAFFEKVGYACERAVVCVIGAARQWRGRIAERKAREERLAAAPPAADFSLASITRKTRAAAAKRRAKTSAPAPAAAVSSSLSSSPAAGASAAADAPPTLSLLDAAKKDDEIPASALRETAELIERSLASFNVSAKVVTYHPGPIVTRYDMRPATGVKGAQIVNLARDLARSLSVSAIRVLETIPGTNFIGLEIPNQKRCTVNLAEIFSSDAYRESQAALPLALGKTASGKAAVADLADMPHLLVAGSTGAGKSVFINAMLLSLLFARAPRQLRFLLIDPKMLELASYADIPHLLAPVVTDMTQAPAALNWAVEEMERRYRAMARAGVRHIAAFNAAVGESKTPPQDEEGAPLPAMPYIVVVIDELADLMMTSGKKVELSISRLAQKARAAGIHMVLATQRPSVDVITGLIKANVPCRLSFQVASKVDSRTILDQMGAESLLGKGDMLYMPSGAGVPQRLHGAFVSDDEVRRVVDHIRRSNQGAPQYLTDFSEAAEGAAAAASGGGAIKTGGDGAAADDGESDALYDEAVEAVLSSRRVSISMVQRKLRIGYNRAARIVESMEKAGLVSPMNDFGVRKVLAPKRD